MTTNDKPRVLDGGSATVSRDIAVGEAAALSIEDIRLRLRVSDVGLSGDEAQLRFECFGPNAVSSHRARVLLVLWHQVRSPLLGLLIIAAFASSFVGEVSDAIIIAVIVVLSVGLGFFNEYRAEKAAEALHSKIHHDATVIRDGHPSAVDVTALVPGDLVMLRLGDIVPADVRLLAVANLEYDESTLTGESLAVEKSVDPVLG